MKIGIECLLADEATSAMELALRLDELNRERRSIEARMQSDAHAAVERLHEKSLHPLQRSGVCLYDASWHQGVVGLVASRVKERLRRPVIAFARADDASLRGSGRSIPGVHIRDVLDCIAARHPDLIVKFGGHAMAAGLTLDLSKLERFARAFDAEVARCLGGCEQADCIETDGELAVEEIALETATAVRSGGPWGQAFPEPCFDGVFVIRSARVVGERHLKMWVEVPMSGRSFDAIAFNYIDQAAQMALPQGSAQLVYRLDINEYQGERRLQLLVDHLLPA
jgi:single-stranded-DNA-specific exonuclease